MEQKEKSARGITRRDVAKAGTAAPLLMTLLSRPAWGGGVCSVSALASGNASGRHEKGCSGNGCPPKFWKNNLQAWKGTGCSPGQQKTNKKGKKVSEWTTQGATTFSSAFGFEPEAGRHHRGGSLTLLDVLLDDEHSGFSGSADSHLVAALLNAAKAPSVFGANTTQIKELARAVRMGTPYQGRVIDHFEFSALLRKMNQAGNCFLNTSGQCAPGYVEHNGTCIPSCKRGYRYDLNSNQCVSLDDWNDNCKGIDD